MVGVASVPGGASVPAPSSAATAAAATARRSAQKAVKVFSFMVHFVTNKFVNVNWRRTIPVPVYCKVEQRSSKISITGECGETSSDTQKYIFTYFDDILTKLSK